MSDYPEPPKCYRCNQPGHVDWCDVSTFGDTEPVWISGSNWCVTPGCVDEFGKRSLFAPTPEQLRARGEAMWMAAQRRLIDE